MATPDDSMDAPLVDPRRENIDAILAENLARPPDFSKMGIEDRHSLFQGNAEVWRTWECPMTEDAARLQDFLTDYVSVNNLTPAAYVVNPMVGGETVYGTFRQVTCRRLRIDGKTILAQGLRRVFAPTTAAELAACAYRTVRGNEILEAFGLGPGEGDEAALIFPDMNPASETVLLGLADADLVTALKTGWTYVTRKFDHGTENVAEFTVILRKVSWNAFVVGAPDITEYQNNGTEHATLTQTYININNTDALTNLYASPAAKYNVIRVSISENKNGALTIVRTSVHEVYGSSGEGTVNAASQKILGVLGLQPGTVDRILVINEDLLSKASAYTATPSGYTLEDMHEELNGQGLWNKYYLYVQATWPNSGGTFYGSALTNVGGFDEGKMSVAPGVPIASAPTILGTTAAETGFIQTQVEWSEGDYGHAVLQKRQAKAWAAGWNVTGSGPVLVDWRPAQGRQPAMDAWCWFRVPPASVGTVVTAAKLLTTYGSGYATGGWVVGGVHIQWHGDGAANVIGELTIPNVAAVDPANIGTAELWGDGTAGVYMLTELIRDSDGLPIYYITYGVAEGRAGSEGSAINQINAVVASSGRAYSSPFSSTAGKVLHKGTDWRRVKDWAYEWKAVWIEDEGVYTP